MKLFWIALAAALVAAPAFAAERACGPGALGTSRPLALGSRGGAAIGLEAYAGAAGG